MAIHAKPSIVHGEFVNYLEKLFVVNVDDIRVIIKEFHVEMQKGLSGHKSSLKMIPAFVDKPKGTEKGKFIALDLGGTNLRVLELELDGKGGSKILAVSRYVIKKKAMQGSGEELFDFIAGSLKDFVKENNISTKRKSKLGFTFSFPIKQTDIASGTLIAWTKGFAVTGVEGKDVVTFLNEALKRQGVTNAKVVALINDAVGTMVTKSYDTPSCDVGVILGTGTNACYIERVANIAKLRDVSQKGNMIINIEWGNFDKLPVTSYDEGLDKASLNPGQKLEKLVSGMYLGEILRLVVCDFINRDLIFFDDNNVFFNQGVIKTEHMSLIERDGSANLIDVEEFLIELGVKNITLYSKKLLRKLCKFISLRSARISASLIAAVVSWMDPEVKNKHTIGIDGSLFELYPGFKSMMEDAFVEIFKEKSKNVILKLSKNGSGKGAAIIAAVAA